MSAARERTHARTWARGRRWGAVSSVELLFVMPLVVGMIFALVEFAMLLKAQQHIETACQVACRVGTLPGCSAAELRGEVRAAACRVLARSRLGKAADVRFEPGRFTGDPVHVEIRVPMRAAAPDLLACFGLSIKRRCLTARTVMRKE